MRDRPERKRLLPIINPAASTMEEHGRNAQAIYSGSLADHRSIVAAQGVYSAQVVPPLVVTDYGIALNLDDPNLIQYVTDAVTDAIGTYEDKWVAVDAGDTPDYLESQLITYDEGASTAIGVTIIKPSTHHPLEGYVDLDDLLGVLYANGYVQPKVMLEAKIHFVGFDSVTLNATDLGCDVDLRDGLYVVWQRGAETLDKLKKDIWTDPGPPPTDYLSASSGRVCPGDTLEGGTGSVINLGGYVIDVATPGIQFILDLDANGKPTLQIVADTDGKYTYMGIWLSGVHYNQYEVVKYSNVYYYCDAPAGLETEPPGANWVEIKPPEAYYHALVLRFRQIPPDETDYTALGDVATFGA